MSERDITTAIQRRFTPKAILTVYTSGGHGDLPLEYYLETRPVSPKGVPGAAVPVSLEFMRSFASAFRDTAEKRPYGPLPGNLLYADPRQGRERYVWWTPPGVRTLHFVPELGLEDGRYHMPGVVYSVTERTLSIFAFQGTRPGRNAPLLMGPFFNYYDDGHVCLGNARDPLPAEPRWEDVLSHWERLFWNSVNSHLICNPVDGNLVVLLKDAVREPFDLTACRPSGVTLNDLLK